MQFVQLPKIYFIAVMEFYVAYNYALSAEPALTVFYGYSTILLHKSCLSIMINDWMATLLSQ